MSGASDEAPASTIGAGLEPTRPARAIRAGERIHVVGVAGAGASAAALLAHHAGGAASGCDPGGPSQYTPALEAAGIPLAWRHDTAHVTTDPVPGRLAVTKALTALDPDHPELRAARAAGIPLEAWQQVVADAAVGRTLVAVAGTHGKSTTAGWLVHALAGAGEDPSAFVGALLPAEVAGGRPATARWGGGAAFVVEADEYAGNFDPYRPDVAVLTSIEWDHPDVFPDTEAVIGAFAAWLAAAAADGRTPTLVTNVGDPNVAGLCRRLASDWPGRIVAVLLADPEESQEVAAARAVDGIDRAIPLVATATAERGHLRLVVHAAELFGPDRTVDLAVAGRHNAANALGVIGAGALLVPPERRDGFFAAVGSFSGVGRRLELKGEAAGVVVYDDYAHHPTAIRVTIDALRQREPGRRLWAVYEPLTYHRTAAMLGPFAEAMAAADVAVVADIWAGRDRDTTVTSADALARAINERRPALAATAPGSVEMTAEWLAEHVRSGDVVLVMGGGRSYRIGELLLDALRAR